MSNDQQAAPETSGGRFRYTYICTDPCFIEKYKDRLCATCGKVISSVMLVTGNKKNKVPTACEFCIKKSRVDPGQCWFCLGQLGKRGILFRQIIAPDGWKNLDVCVIACKTCHTTPSCGKNACNPAHPCHKCLQEPEAEIMGQVDNANNHIPTAFYFKQPAVFHRVTNASERRKNKSTRLISAEIESTGLRWNDDAVHGQNKIGPIEYLGCLCRNCRQNRMNEINKLIMTIGGSIVPDESIGSKGFEINMPPAAGDHFVNLTQKVSDLLHNSMAEVTLKAGTHIHLDANDYSWSDMRKFLILYAKTEPAFLYTQPYDRVYKNPKPHCRPCGAKYMKLAEKFQHKDWKPALADIVYDGEWPRPPRFFRGNNRAITARYDFVNIHSWFYRGTVEIRGHAGTIDASKIINWGIIWASFMDAATKMTEKEILSLPNNDPKQILLSIAPSHTHPYLFNRWEVFEPEYHKKGKD